MYLKLRVTFSQNGGLNIVFVDKILYEQEKFRNGWAGNHTMEKVKKQNRNQKSFGKSMCIQMTLRPFPQPP